MGLLMLWIALKQDLTNSWGPTCRTQTTRVAQHGQHRWYSAPPPPPPTTTTNNLPLTQSLNTQTSDADRQNLCHMQNVKAEGSRHSRGPSCRSLVGVGKKCSAPTLSKSCDIWYKKFSITFLSSKNIFVKFIITV